MIEHWKPFSESKGIIIGFYNSTSQVKSIKQFSKVVLYVEDTFFTIDLKTIHKIKQLKISFEKLICLFEKLNFKKLLNN